MASKIRKSIKKKPEKKPNKIKKKLVIIVPYRNREPHLKKFIPYMKKYLEKYKNKIDYKILVIHQFNKNMFNKGALFNIGFNLTKNHYDYFCFHDVDLLPEDADYSYVKNPTHLSAFVSEFNYKLPYNDIFGGAVMFNKKDFIKVNGYSNKFLGWGAEDDELYHRIKRKNLKFTRRLGRYESLPYLETQAKTNPEKRKNNPHFRKNIKLYRAMRDGRANVTADGLNKIGVKIKYQIINKKCLDADIPAYIYDIDFNNYK